MRKKPAGESTNVCWTPEMVLLKFQTNKLCIIFVFRTRLHK